jgi:hypothetical protein
MGQIKTLKASTLSLELNRTCFAIKFSNKLGRLNSLHLCSNQITLSPGITVWCADDKFK